MVLFVELLIVMQQVSTQYISPTSGELIEVADDQIFSKLVVSTQYISPTSGELILMKK
jgi:hypothetical protein